MMEIVGWMGSVLLAFCGLPQALQSWRAKSSDGISWGFILMWGAGEVLTLLYVFPKMEMPLVFNYTANIIFISVIAYYKIYSIGSRRSEISDDR